MMSWLCLIFFDATSARKSWSSETLSEWRTGGDGVGAGAVGGGDRAWSSSSPKSTSKFGRGKESPWSINRSTRDSIHSSSMSMARNELGVRVSDCY